MSPKLLRVTLGTVTGLLAALLYLGVRGTGPAGEPPGPDPFLPDPVPAPALALEAPDGRTVTLEDFRGRVVALFFGYTWCPDVCPITLAQLARIRSDLDPDGDGLEIVFVSLDPARDDPARLAEYAGAFQAGVTALTGPVDRLRPQALAWGIGFLYRPRDGGPADSVAPLPGGPMGDDYLVDHTARTFVIDRGGRLVAQVLPETDAGTLRRVLERVLEAG